MWEAAIEVWEAAIEVWEAAIEVWEEGGEGEDRGMRGAGEHGRVGALPPCLPRSRVGRGNGFGLVSLPRTRGENNG